MTQSYPTPRQLPNEVTVNVVSEHGDFGLQILKVNLITSPRQAMPLNPMTLLRVLDDKPHDVTASNGKSMT